MTFLEYLEKILGIDEKTQGPDGMIYRTLRMRGGSCYREVSVRMAGLGEITDRFESLWSAYNYWSSLDESKKKDPVGWAKLHE